MKGKPSPTASLDPAGNPSYHDVVSCRFTPQQKDPAVGPKFRLAVTSLLVTQIEESIPEAFREAANGGADLILLPEEPDIVMGWKPGLYRLTDHPIYSRMASFAAEYGIGAVASVSAVAGNGFANTGFLIDRKGALAGVYRKQHPAPGEEAIVTDQAGDDPFPVFEFDGVVLGIAICMDIHFPEMFCIYGLKCADIVCLPTMYMDYTGDMLESIEKARAVDNQYYVALSRYIETPYLAGKSMGYAKVIAPDGRIIASTGHQAGVAVAEFDPKWRMPFWGEQYKEFRTMFHTTRKPEKYGKIVEPKK